MSPPKGLPRTEASAAWTWFDAMLVRTMPRICRQVGSDLSVLSPGNIYAWSLQREVGQSCLWDGLRTLVLLPQLSRKGGEGLDLIRIGILY